MIMLFLDKNIKPVPFHLLGCSLGIVSVAPPTQPTPHYPNAESSLPMLTLPLSYSASQSQPNITGATKMTILELLSHTVLPGRLETRRLT